MLSIPAIGETTLNPRLVNPTILNPRFGETTLEDSKESVARYILTHVSRREQNF